MRRGFGVGGLGLAAAFSALFAACGTTSLKPPDNTGGAGTGGSGGAGGTDLILPPGGTSISIDGCAAGPIPTPLARWSVADLDNTLDMLFAPGPRLADSYQPETGYQRSLSPQFVRALLDVATARVGAVAADAAALESCPDDEAEGANCAQRWLRDWGLKLYRRPLSSEQLTAYSISFESQREQHSAGEAAKNALVSMILSPYFVLRIELGSPADATVLTPYEVATRLSHFAARRSPDAELNALAASGAILQSDQRLAQLHRLWSMPEGRAARRLQFAEWLGVSTPLARDDLDPQLLVDMNAQLGSLIDDVFEEQQGSFTKLLTSPRQLMSRDLAAHYGLPAPTGDPNNLVDLSPTPYAGALATGPFLARFNGPSERGRQIREALMCQPLIPHPIDDSHQLGSGTTPRERIHAAVDGKTGCVACHQLVDSLGFALEAFDDQGRLTGFDTTGAFQNDLTSTTTALNGPLELGLQIAESFQGLTCAARRNLEYTVDAALPVTTQARIALNPRPDPVEEWTSCLANILAAHRGSLTSIAETVVSSSLLLWRADAAHYVVAFDTSPDPLEHAYQETMQFREVFPEPADASVILPYATALRQVRDAADTAPLGGAGGVAAGGLGGADGTGGAP